MINKEAQKEIAKYSPEQKDIANLIMNANRLIE